MCLVPQFVTGKDKLACIILQKSLTLNPACFTPCLLMIYSGFLMMRVHEYGGGVAEMFPHHQQNCFS